MGNTGPLSFNCDMCNYKSGSETLMKRHMQNVHKNNPANGQKRISDRSDTEKTNKLVTSNENTPANGKKFIRKRLQCDKCEKKLNKKQMYINHMSSVHKEVVGKRNKELLLKNSKHVVKIVFVWSLWTKNKRSFY